MIRDASRCATDVPLCIPSILFLAVTGPHSGPAGPKIYLHVFFAKTSSVEQNTIDASWCALMRSDSPYTPFFRPRFRFPDLSKALAITESFNKSKPVFKGAKPTKKRNTTTTLPCIPPPFGAPPGGAPGLEWGLRMSLQRWHLSMPTKATWQINPSWFAWVFFYERIKNWNNSERFSMKLYLKKQTTKITHKPGFVYSALFYSVFVCLTPRHFSDYVLFFF